MQVTPVSDRVGALVSDIDITQVTADDIAAIDAAWLVPSPNRPLSRSRRRR